MKRFLLILAVLGLLGVLAGTGFAHGHCHHHGYGHGHFYAGPVWRPPVMVAPAPVVVAPAPVAVPYRAYPYYSYPPAYNYGPQGVFHFHNRNFGLSLGF